MMGAQDMLLKLLLCGLLASLVTTSAIKGKIANTGSENNRPFWTKTTPITQELTDHSGGENDEVGNIAKQQAEKIDANTGFLDDNRHSSDSLDQQQVKLEIVSNNNQPAELSQHFQENQQQEIVTNQEEYPSTGLLPADEITYTRDQFQQQFNPSSRDSSFGARIHENSDFSSTSCSVKGGCVQLIDDSASKINYGSSDVSYSNEGTGNQEQDGQFGQQQQLDTFSRSEKQSQEQIEISVPEKDQGFSSSFDSQHVDNDFPGDDHVSDISKDKNEDEKSNFFRDEQTQTHTGNLDLAAPYDETGRQQDYVPPEQNPYQNTYPNSQTIDDFPANFNDGSNVPPRSEQFGDQNRNDGYNSQNTPSLFDGQSIIPDEESFNHQNGHDGQYHYLGNPIDWLKEAVPGNPGVDYPIFYKVPETSFSCNQQQFEAGIYGDMDASCQVFHICKANGGQDSFLCPNGTVFNQQYFVCDWWYNYNCADTPAFYNLNAQLYWDIDSFTPSRILTGNSGVDGSSLGQVGITNGDNFAYGGGQHFQPDISNTGQEVAFQKNQEDYSVISDQRRINSETGGNGLSQQTANDQIPQHDGLRYDTQSTVDFQKTLEDTAFPGLEGNYGQIQIDEPINNPAAEQRPIDEVIANGKNLDNAVPVQTTLDKNAQENNILSTGSDLRRGTVSANNDGPSLNENSYVQQFINDENYFKPNQEISRKDGESTNTNLPANEKHEIFQTTIQPTSGVQDTEYTRYAILNQGNNLSPEIGNKQPVENVIFPDQRDQYPEIGQSAFKEVSSIDRVSDNTGFDGSPRDNSQSSFPVEVQQQAEDISFSRGDESTKTINEDTTQLDSPGSISPRHEAGESSFQQQPERVIFPYEFSRESIDSTKPSRSGGHVVVSTDNRDIIGIQNNPIQHIPQSAIDDVDIVDAVQQAPEQVVQTNSDEVRKENVANIDTVFRGSKESAGSQNGYEQQQFIDVPDISQSVRANHNALEDFQKRNIAFMPTGYITLTALSPDKSSSTTAPKGSVLDHSKLIQQNIDETSQVQISNQIKNADSSTENRNTEPQTQNFRVEDIHSMVRGPQRIRQTEQQRNRDSINQRFIFKPNQRQISNVDANSYGSNTQELIQTENIQQTNLPQDFENQQIHQQQQNIPSQRNRFVLHVNEGADSVRNHGTSVNHPEVKGIASNQPLVTPVNSVNWWSQMPQKGPVSSHSRPSTQRQKSNFEFQQRDISYDERAPVQVFQESLTNTGVPKSNFDLPQQVRLQNNYKQQNAFGSESRAFRPQSQEISRQPQLRPYPLSEQHGPDDQTRNQNSEQHSQSNFHVTSGVKNFQENSRNIKSLGALSTQNHGPGYSQVVPSSSEITQNYNGWKPIVRQ